MLLIAVEWLQMVTPTSKTQSGGLACQPVSCCSSLEGILGCSMLIPLLCRACLAVIVGEGEFLQQLAPTSLYAG